MGKRKVTSASKDNLDSKKLLKSRTRILDSIDSSRSNLLSQVLLHWKDGTLIGMPTFYLDWIG